jgi:ATP-dependent helicase/nuclease subunit B
MLTYFTGRARAVRGALFRALKDAMAQGDHPVLLIVPAQYTLEAELDAVDELNLTGSFRLQVLSPQRLHQRVFEAAGRPARVRIDVEGRVMLLQRAADRLSDELRWYRGASRRPGFAERAVDQIESFKQAGILPEDVRRLAQAEGGALREKLQDISRLYEAYEQSLAGRFLDGEDEAREAALRLPDAPVARGDVFLYGFDLITQGMARLILALTGCAKSVKLFLTLENDGDARDFQVFQPVQKAFERLHRQVLNAGVPWKRARLDESAEDTVPAIHHLSRELFCWPSVKFAGEPEGLTVATLNNPQDEAEYAAALIRDLVMRRGWRYRDVMVACQSLDDNAIFALTRAFQLYGVPLFLSQSRAADRHPLARCLLAGIRLASQRFMPEDVSDYARSGFAPVTDDEADLLLNYAQEAGLKGRAWLRPLTRGTPEVVAALEPVRQRLMGPVEALQRRARNAPAERLLEAAFLFLEEIGAREALEAQQAALTDMGRREWAMEGAQVWNRVIQALDQAHELFAGEPLNVRALYELLRRALGAAEIKALPQSGDAVMGGGLDHMKGRPVKALFILGATESVPGAGGALLSEREMARLTDQGLWLGLTVEDRARLTRLNVKSALALAEELVYVTCPRSDRAGAAQKPGALIRLMKRMFPLLKEQGSVLGVAEKRLRLAAPEAALSRASAILRDDPLDPDARAALHILGEMPEYAGEVAQLSLAFHHRVHSEPLPPALRDRADAVSATRLERFIACPFKDFVSSILRPGENREFDLTPRDVGIFYHEALEAFARENGARLGDMPLDEAVDAMDRVTAGLLEGLADRAIGESAVLQREGQRIASVARRAARTLVGHLSGSRFQPVALEVDFGLGDGRILLKDVPLKGRIDRVDAWQDGEVRYLRVIDYKTRGKAVSLEEVYYGLQLQLILYLAAAVARGGKPAGVFYFAIDDPLVRTPSRDPEEVERLREKELRLDGLALSDEKVLSAMSPRPEAVLGVGGRRNNLVTPEDFQLLMDHAANLADDALARIREGDTSIQPALWSGGDACELCDYKSVCQIAPGLPGAEARRLPKLPDAAVIEQIRDDAGLTGDGERDTVARESDETEG